MKGRAFSFCTRDTKMRKINLVVLLLLFVVVTAVHAQQAIDYGYTYTRADGNRFIDGTGSFPDVELTTISLEDRPLWIVGGLVNDIPMWVVALVNGSVQAVQPLGEGDAVTAMAIEIGQLPPGQPPLAAYDGENLPQLVLAGEDMARFTHPVPVADGALAYVAENGDLVLWRDGDELDRAALNLQPDARVVVNEAGLIGTYANASNTRYVHAIMGDDLEGFELVVLDPADDTLTEISRVMLPGEQVFEGISPFWADVDSDGTDDLVTTVSDSANGALIRAYRVDGTELASSNAIGLGFRWRHQLAFGPFGRSGTMQIVDVRTPHIGGIVEFFDLRDGELPVGISQIGYTSHVINSPNLDMGVAGDFDGDGLPEVVVTNQSRDTIAAVTNGGLSVDEMWTLPLDGALITNLAALQLADGSLALAAGTNTSTLHIWAPAP